MQGVQRQSCKTDIQENIELVEKVSIGKHNDCSLIFPIDVLFSDVENFERRNIKILLWTLEKHSSYNFLADIIKNGLKLDFIEIPLQHCCKNCPLSNEEMSIINSEIQKLKNKKVIINTNKRTSNYISGGFTRSKKHSSHKMILNLKNFNNLYATDISRWIQYKIS